MWNWILTPCECEHERAEGAVSVGSLGRTEECRCARLGPSLSGQGVRLGGDRVRAPGPERPGGVRRWITRRRSGVVCVQGAWLGST